MQTTSMFIPITFGANLMSCLQDNPNLKGHKRSLVSNFSYFCYGSAAILYYTSDVIMKFGRSFLASTDFSSVSLR